MAGKSEKKNRNDVQNVRYSFQGTFSIRKFAPTHKMARKKIKKVEMMCRM
jgi:hypothetical protein